MTVADVHIKQVLTNEVIGCKSNPCEIKVMLPTAPNTFILLPGSNDASDRGYPQ